MVFCDTLIERAQSGDIDALEKIYIEYKDYGYYIKKFYILGKDKEDLLQEIRISSYICSDSLIISTSLQILPHFSHFFKILVK